MLSSPASRNHSLVLFINGCYPCIVTSVVCALSGIAGEPIRLRGLVDPSFRTLFPFWPALGHGASTMVMGSGGAVVRTTGTSVRVGALMDGIEIRELKK